MKHGIIVKVNNDLKYGFIQIQGMDEIFYTEKTNFIKTKFSELKLNDKVIVSIKKTSRGLFATTLQLAESVQNINLKSKKDKLKPTKIVPG